MYKRCEVQNLFYEYYYYIDYDYKYANSYIRFILHLLWRKTIK